MKSMKSGKSASNLKKGPKKSQSSTNNDDIGVYLQSSMATSYAKNLSEYLNMNKNVTSKNNRCKKFFKKLRLKQNLMLLLTIYNLVYMPIQMAFRIPFEGIFLGLECLTIVAYVFDIGWRAHKLRKLLRIHSISDRKLRLKDRKLKRDTELLKQTISTQRTEVIMTAIAIFPFNLLFQHTEWIQPRGFTAALCSFRMVKAMPLVKMFRQLGKHSLNIVRIVEVVTYYYIIANWYACLGLQMAMYDDWTSNWLRRCPVPQPGGLRTTPNGLENGDINVYQLYLHSLYFMVSTFSEVAVADITATNMQEYWAGSLLLWSTTFIYILLFANIASVV